MRRIFVLALAMCLFSAAPASSETIDDLSLEELLAVELDNMIVTGVRHTHDKGEWMIGLEFMYMRMDGNRDGTERLSTDDVIGEGYMVAPKSMNMAMYMFHLMYAPTDWVSVMMMAPYLSNSMDHVTMMGSEFTTRSRGLGDIEITGLFRLFETETQKILGEVGLSFPTGSIDESDNLPSGWARLPYPMQLGSGTWDVPLGLTYIGQLPKWNWGVRAGALLRTGENDNDYRLGHEWEVTTWLSRLVVAWLSGTLRLDYNGRANIEGADPTLNPAIVPTADPDLQESHRIDMLFGLNVFASKGWAKGHNVTFEAGLPVYQWLEGPQLETDWRLSLSWQYTF